MTADWHLAQLNVARMAHPLDSPEMAQFVEALDPVNALADEAPGFVWRLQTEDGDATSIRAFDDDSILVNMSVWESVEALKDYAYRSDHREVLRRRAEWFAKMREAYLVLWWVPAGHRPTVAEAKERLEHLREHGSTAHAFTFAKPHPSPAADEESTALQ